MGLLRRRTVRPSIVRKIGVHQPAADERHDAFGNADVHFARCQRTIEQERSNEGISHGTRRRRHTEGRPSRHLTMSRVAGLPGQKIRSDPGADADADSTIKEAAVLPMIEPAYKAIVTGWVRAGCTSCLRLQPDRHDQGQRRKEKSFHLTTPPPYLRAPMGAIPVWLMHRE